MGRCRGIEDDGERCKRNASFGYKNGPRVYCKRHMDPIMKNVSGYMCGTCGERAFYGYFKTDEVLYCWADKKDDMINVLNKMCIICHLVQPTYNIEGEKKPLYCAKCASTLTGTTNVRDNKCKTCNEVVACFGYPGGKPEYCSADKLDGMEDVTKRKCLGCDTIPNWNYPGESRGIYCADCKLDGMQDLKNVKCKTCGLFTASYGFDNKKEYCAGCKLDGMSLIGQKYCKYEGCGQPNPTFGFPGQTKGYCSAHKQFGMSDLKHTMCEKCGEITATFNFTGLPPRFCKDDSELGMIDVTAIRCTQCQTTATFGIPGNPPTVCAQHKFNGVIPNPRKRCIHEGCKEIAIYGIGKQIHCEDHVVTGEYNLIEKECKSCKLLMILNKDNLCGFCDPTMIKNLKLVKQKEVKALLDTKKYKYTIYDKIIDSKCGLERPDFLFDCDAYFVVLEVDEGQHMRYDKTLKNVKDNVTYDCEMVRMFNIFQTIGMKTIFIRYNPDDYKVKGVKQSITKIKRHNILLKQLNNMTKLNAEKLDYLSVMYLFYDEFNEKTITLEKIEMPY